MAATYSTVTKVNEFLDVTDVSEAEIERAERMIDRGIGIPVTYGRARLLDPSRMDAYDLEQLEDAIAFTVKEMRRRKKLEELENASPLAPGVQSMEGDGFKVSAFRGADIAGSAARAGLPREAQSALNSMGMVREARLGYISSKRDGEHLIVGGHDLRYDLDLDEED